MIDIFDNISPTLLKIIYLAAINSGSWKFKYPESFSFDDRFAKIDVISMTAAEPMLSGLAAALLCTIYDSKQTKYFDPSLIAYCGISMKDKGLGEDNIHTDHDPTKEEFDPRLPFDEFKLIKLVGVLNEDWTTETDGGTFECDGEEVEMKPGRFVLFNPRKPHRAGKVLSNKKRLALDLAVNPSPYYNMNYG